MQFESMQFLFSTFSTDFLVFFFKEEEIGFNGRFRIDADVAKYSGQK